MKFLFLGVGNRERADDAVGPMLAERLLADKTGLPKNIHIQPHSGEGASLMHVWEGYDRVVIVDAMKSGLRLGTVRRFDAAKEPLSYGVFRYSSHLFGLAEAVEMARALGTLPPEVVIYGIEGRVFEFGAAMSKSVAASMARVEISVRHEWG